MVQADGGPDEEAVRHKQEGYAACRFRLGSEWANSGMTVEKYIPYLRRMREAVEPALDKSRISTARAGIAGTGTKRRNDVPA